ncbi:RND superfamily putative drug exporter [Nocardia tenerifensis]|uniref:RND superfamily putative drug exporter n=1 Tax=Nocardia tenerifensis TaxID=228006 RepID=A0A318KB85_9NOCA|nr:RND family transporter [Nocardia tenerifensis]PXX71781.1 RND superfamily putative drug exporter [Nocardia tenerifensis]
MRRRLFDRLGSSVHRFRYVVVATWLLAAGLLNLAVPQLESTVFEHSTPMVPQDAPAAAVLREMNTRFGESADSGSAFLVLTRAEPLTDADRAYYDKVVAALRAERGHVASVLDLWASPVTAGSVVSADRKAVYTQLQLVGDTGTTEVSRSLAAVHDALATIPPPQGLSVDLTGPSPTFADELNGIHHALTTITLLTVALITVLLLATYRSLSTAVVPLFTIGLALATARPLVSLLGAHGLPTSIFSVALLSAMILGAGTDYGIFLISRYHEGRRAALSPHEAYRSAYRRIMPIIVASGLIVAMTCAVMTVTRIGVFRTIGIPCSVGVLVTVAAAMTLAPALLVIAADRGLVEPTGGAARYWPRLSAIITAHPARMLAASLAVIAALALVTPTLIITYDERATQPSDTPSNRGYAAAAAHFAANELLPSYVLIRSDHDMRTARDYAAIETLATEIARVPGVASVRTISRPLGTPIPDAAVDRQVGLVGDRLGSAADQLAAARPEVRQLSGGVTQLNDGAKALAAGMSGLAGGFAQAGQASAQLVDGSGALADGIDRLVAGVDGLSTGVARLRSGSAELVNGVDAAMAPVNGSLSAIDGLRALVAADPNCPATPLCVAAQAALSAFDSSAAGTAVGELTRLRDGVRALSDGHAQLAAGVDQLATGLAAAQGGSAALRDGQARLHQGIGALGDGIGQARTGADALSAGTDRVHDGVTRMTRVYDELPAGLEQAVDYLHELQGNQTIAPGAGGFNLPDAAMTNPDLTTAARLFLSPDGHAARMIVVGTADAFSAEGMALAQRVTDAGRHAAVGTPLAGAAIDTTGLAATYVDVRTLAFRDLVTIVVAASMLILLVLAIMLRSLIAPLYVFGSVLLSYLAALGFSVLIWQHLLDNPLHWTVPSMSFIALTAVGADYNLLLMSRVRDELRAAPQNGLRAAVATALTRTGGVITTAGIVFALTMLALMFSDISNIAQIGFTIATGLLLDTLVVRTVTIPAMALLAGRWNWWPSRLSRPDPAPAPGA